MGSSSCEDLSPSRKFLRKKSSNKNKLAGPEGSQSATNLSKTMYYSSSSSLGVVPSSLGVIPSNSVGRKYSAKPEYANFDRNGNLSRHGKLKKGVLDLRSKFEYDANMNRGKYHHHQYDANNTKEKDDAIKEAWDEVRRNKEEARKESLAMAKLKEKCALLQV